MKTRRVFVSLLETPHRAETVARLRAYDGVYFVENLRTPRVISTEASKLEDGHHSISWRLKVRPSKNSRIVCPIHRTTWHVMACHDLDDLD